MPIRRMRLKNSNLFYRFIFAHRGLYHWTCGSLGLFPHMHTLVNGAALLVTEDYLNAILRHMILQMET